MHAAAKSKPDRITRKGAWEKLPTGIFSTFECSVDENASTVRKTGYVPPEGEFKTVCWPVSAFRRKYNRLPEKSRIVALWALLKQYTPVRFECISNACVLVIENLVSIQCRTHFAVRVPVRQRTAQYRRVVIVLRGYTLYACFFGNVEDCELDTAMRLKLNYRRPQDVCPTTATADAAAAVARRVTCTGRTLIVTPIRIATMYMTSVNGLTTITRVPEH